MTDTSRHALMAEIKQNAVNARQSKRCSRAATISSRNKSGEQAATPFAITRQTVLVKIALMLISKWYSCSSGSFTAYLASRAVLFLFHTRCRYACTVGEGNVGGDPADSSKCLASVSVGCISGGMDRAYICDKERSFGTATFSPNPYSYNERQSAPSRE